MLADRYEEMRAQCNKSSNNGWHESSENGCLIFSVINHPIMDGMNHSKMDV